MYNTTQMMLSRTGITLTALQTSLLSTVYQWYNGSNTTNGELAFLTSISALAEGYSNETDLRALQSLSLLNVGSQAQYKFMMEPSQMIQAREILKTALQSEPNHPGILHYLIHAYDVPVANVAQQGAGYATSYGMVVKTASHAQHMPSHIWVQLGE